MHVKGGHKSSSSRQTLLTQIGEQSTSKSSINTEFSTDLCETLMASNIPMHKVNNPAFKKFLQKYCVGHNIPDESTLRKNYVPGVYQSVLQSIREDIGDNYIWVSTDETTDACGRSDATAISESQEAFRDSAIKKDIAQITTHFAHLPSHIKQLETRGLPLSGAIEIIDSLKKYNSTLPLNFPEKLRRKLEDVFRKNPGLETMVQVHHYINGVGQELPDNIPHNIAPILKFCPMTSVDVERSFSQYKMILSDRRHGFTMSNMEKYMVVQFYKCLE
ncbi:hypothetical protein WDU94_003651 [Cyamophila willieti]